MTFRSIFSPCLLTAAGLAAVVAFSAPAAYADNHNESKPTSQPVKLHPASQPASQPASRPAVKLERPGQPDTGTTLDSEKAKEAARQEAAQDGAKAKKDDRPSTGPTRIIVKWVAETAVDNFGYNVYRADEMTSAPYWQKLNRRILPGIGTTSQPTVMRYMDITVGDDLDKIYYYKVQEISSDGGKSYFSHPVTGEIPFILKGTPKVISESEQERFAESPFAVEHLDR